MKYVCLDSVSVVMLMFTCRQLRGLMIRNHEFWRRVYEKWNYNASPEAPQIRDVPNHHVLQLPPVMLPDSFAHFMRTTYAEKEQASFNWFAWKHVMLSYSFCCFRCRQPGFPVQMWHLSECLCADCAKEEFVSSETLRYQHGVVMNSLVPTRPDGELRPFLQSVYLRVYYFVNEGRPFERHMFSANLHDKRPSTGVPVAFFSKTNLRQVFFWDEHLRLQKERKQQASVLWRFLNPARTLAVQLYQESFANNIRTDRFFFAFHKKVAALVMKLDKFDLARLTPTVAFSRKNNEVMYRRLKKNELRVLGV